MITNLILIIVFTTIFIIIAKIDEYKPSKLNARIGLIILCILTMLAVNLVLTFIKEML